MALASQALPPGQLVAAPTAQVRSPTPPLTINPTLTSTTLTLTTFQEVSSMDNMFSSLGLSSYVDPARRDGLAASLNMVQTSQETRKLT